MRKLVVAFGIFGIFSLVKSQDCDTNLLPDGIPYSDTYRHVAWDTSSWKHYNTHDPTVYKDGDWYYMYSTDASYGGVNDNGALKRRSKDLVNWEFLGNAFDGVPQSAVDFFQINNPGYTDMGIWAPFLFKLKDKYILYYSAPGGPDGVNHAYIGYATSDSANGPWEDQGKITTSWSNSDYINAIDPTVVFDSIEERLWMAYGSWASGTYLIELDTASGGIKTPGDRGVKIAQRSGTNTEAMEGPELVYRNGYYYLILSYDWLGDLYNLRVGRATNPQGPYLDFSGDDLALNTDNEPMILAPYKFNNHPGWQGTGHCGVYNDHGDYYIFHQGRPPMDAAMMVLHARKIMWIDDWPVISPERYAGVPQCNISSDSLVGFWDHIPLIYNNNANSNFFSTSQSVELSADGTFNNTTTNTWSLNNDTLVFSWNNGQFIDKALVFWGYDWEYKRKTILYSGLNQDGLCIWGKKIDKSIEEKYPHTLTHGATYKISAFHSEKFVTVAGGSTSNGANIVQDSDLGNLSQLWKLRSTGINSFYYLFPQHVEDENMVMEVSGSGNGANFRINAFKGTTNQQFRLLYNNNGYYRITSRLSNNTHGADVDNFSRADGANILQWSYAGSQNQNWRFEIVDSLGIDETEVDTFTIGIFKLTVDNTIEVYPNPSSDGKFKVDLTSISTQPDKNIYVSVYDLRGVELYATKVEGPGIIDLDLSLKKGYYLLKANADNKLFVQKLMVQ